MQPLADLLDDLTLPQLTALLTWLWVNTYAVTRGNIKAWRRDNSLVWDI